MDLEKEQWETPNPTDKELTDSIKRLLYYCIQTGVPQTIEFETDGGEFVLVAAKLTRSSQ